MLSGGVQPQSETGTLFLIIQGMEKENMGFVPNNAKWYLTEIVEEITVADTVANKVHRNLILIRADSPDEAYEKAVRFGREADM